MAKNGVEKMDKEKILEKYRSENKDEGKDYDNDYSDNQCFYAMCFLAIGVFYRYKLRKDKRDLYFSLITGAVGLAFLIWYVIQTI